MSVGTTALATTSINLAKTGAYSSFALLSWSALGIAVGIGIIMTAGAYLGGLLVRRTPERVFVFIVEGVMIGAGVSLLVQS